MKQTIRTFALGLLTATTVLGVTYFMEAPSPETSKPLTIEEMMAEVERRGYEVLSNQEFAALQSEPTPSDTLRNDREGSRQS